MSKKIDIFIAFPVYREVPAQTVTSLLRTVEALNAEHVSYQFCFMQGCSQVVNARNLLVKQFLETACTHLFWLDADMVWAPEQFLAVATAGKDCLNAPYVAKDTRFHQLNHGLGFCCVKREIIEKLSKAAPMGVTVEGNFPQVFQYAPHLGIAGEDIEFYRAVQALGYQTTQAQGLQLGHVGLYVYKEQPDGEKPNSSPPALDGLD